MVKLESQESLLPGLKPVLELLAHSPGRIARVLCRKDWARGVQITAICRHAGVPVEYMGNDELDALCANGKYRHQGVIAVLTPVGLLSDTELFQAIINAPLPLGLALDQIQDAGNLGAISRTAYALGCGGILLPRHNACGLGPGAFKTSAGALEKLPVAITPNLGRALDSAEELGLTIYGARALDSAANCGDVFSLHWQFPAIIVLGNENRGIRPGVAKRCSQFLAIPFMREFDSLNVAQAAAIFIGLAARQRHK